MLSRVAAVKAPRTHNRHRVTGSSGRRREGRESEPQGHNMSRHLFYSAMLLLLVVMMCCGSGAAPSSESSKSKRFVWRDKKDEETVVSLRVPSLVEMDGDVFAVAEAEDTKKEEGSFTGIASELLALTGEQASMELDKAKLNTQLLEKCSSDKGKCAAQIAAHSGTESEKRVDVARPTTVVKGSEIYMLAGIYNLDEATGTSAYWGLLLSRGNVSVDKESKKRIYWNDVDALQSISNVQQQESLTDLIGGGGSGVKMRDGTLVFPVEGIKSNGAAGGTNTVSLVIYSLGNEGWKLSKDVSAGGCSDPSVVEWEKDKLMMMTACDDGRRRVYESVDKGESWTEALGTLSRVWGNKQTGPEKGVGSGFITATIEDRDVMLVTLPVYAKNGEGKGHEKNENGKLHLWLTDNTHIVDIGPVSGKDEGITASSLLYKIAGSGNKKEELIALYEKKSDDKDIASLGMVSVLLTEQLKRVKEVLATWKKVDGIVSKLCTNSIAQEVTSPDTACRIAMPTKGLVGFLSGDFSNKTWRDEYLGVNATVKENDGGAAAATGTSDKGVKFTGAWAEWPVGKQGENQLYHFANYNFTLVATVSIDGEPKEDNPIPLMGVMMNGDGKTKLMELSYDSGKNWQLLCGGNTTKENSNTWEKEKTQHVVLLIRNGSHFSAYADGKQVGEDVPRELENTHSKGISHFYIGGDGGSTDNKEGVSVTVTNVLLYNRPLSSEEIGAIDPNKDSTPSLEKEAAKPSTVSSASIMPPAPPVTPNAQKAGNPSTAGTQLTEQGQSMGSSGAGSDGASASAVSTVSTPSAEEESVVQVTSGTSPDGTQTVGGGSTADGEPTMETREGGTNGQEEEVNTQDREVNATALGSNLGNVPQGNNSDAGAVRESGMVPSLLLLLLGLWGLAAL
ncbi:putative trans-sialidase, Group V [Trypanosoma cruzi]|uniref:Trans-sialidase, putative n=2 Tax=Trypanosoma cruzi TaxID=5693 RepID=Q4DVF0_TRYCC|nr:trans-sialidase, putative [Trypanosoma cruzi]EAN96502.1 trans-sialidase, putative [Trypanosoma cruzi]PWU89938.1 putative trans-sialidase, Group V [Trypanosoma cruzi]RNC36485.1 c71 surface protein [Trypanosoma cruzi]|eukprot:XP_818353.1 trans-sialidase [Trypanosoma cruzi strain CL Brener]